MIEGSSPRGLGRACTCGLWAQHRELGFSEEDAERFPEVSLSDGEFGAKEENPRICQALPGGRPCWAHSVHSRGLSGCSCWCSEPAWSSGRAGSRLWGDSGVPVHRIGAPGELSGASFTHRNSHTLPFIWAGPLTSTEKGFFQGCLAANCWVDWQAAEMKEKPARALPSPSLPSGAGLGWAGVQPTSGPAPPQPLPASSAPVGRHGSPYVLPTGLARGQLIPGSYPTPPGSCSSLLAGARFQGARLHGAKYCKALLGVSCTPSLWPPSSQVCCPALGQ